MLTAQAIAEFKQIYLDHYGVMLTDADAVEKAYNLLNLCRIVYSTPRTINESSSQRDIDCRKRRR